VPVPINDAQNAVNYDDPPAEYQEMAEANETVINQPNQTGYAQGSDVQAAEPAEQEGERIPASDQMDENPEVSPPVASPELNKKNEESEIFNQEVEN
jgi:hypothetical protein